ncbi:MAG: dihydroneopterin aldolase [Verrucomicrobiae bacterium]|nr:dihydroneopterin aldolase [Verrucomicrobiae bacterium]
MIFRNNNRDRIHICDLRLRTFIGIHPRERQKKQPILVNIVLHAGLRKAGKSDDFRDAVDYQAVAARIRQIVEKFRFNLLEALAERIAETCLEFEDVRQADVRVDKPGALRHARSAGVKISRRPAKLTLRRRR